MMYRIPRVQAELGGRGRTALYSDIKAGLLPAPVKIGGRVVAMPAREVEAVIAARVAGQSEDQIRELVKRLHSARAAHAAAFDILAG